MIRLLVNAAISLTTVLWLAGAPSAAAQDPSAELMRQTLQAQGLSSAEIERLLAANAAGAIDTTGMGEIELADPARDLLDAEAPEAAPAPAAADSGTAEGAELEPRTRDPEELERFGRQLFAGDVDRFAPPAYGPIDPSYRLGPGDEIVLDVWGDVILRLATTIDRQGNVMLRDVGQLNLAGLTLAAAKDRLRARLSASYSGLDADPPSTFLDVSLGALRPVKVFVVGEVEAPGAYDLTAASTLLHGLVQAGGPTDLGSMRDIRLLRGDRVVANFDVYDYLVRGLRRGDVHLQHDDTIFVPVRGKTVTARGEITRPAVYELKDDESLRDLVRLAGGATALTHFDVTRIERILPPAEREAGREPRVTLDAPLGRVLAGEREFALSDLDDITFAAAPEDRTNYVDVAGSVWFPSTYAYEPGLRVADALRAAGGVRGDVFSGRALIVRTNRDETRETITFHVEDALNGDPEHNLALAPRDEITIYSRWDLEDRPTVSIGGAVRLPGEYEMTEDMTLGQLLVMAGGFQEYAWPDSVEVSRVYPEEGDANRIAHTFRKAVGGDFLSRPELPSFRLKRHDHVFVRRQPFWELQRDVRVAGQVIFPGTYSLESPTERLADVVARTGGLRDTAYPEGAQLVRTLDDVGRVSIDLRRALKSPKSDANLVLVAGDSLYVPERPMTVKVTGAVNYPTSHVFRDGKSIGWYVNNSGGYRDDANGRETSVIYSTGRAAKVRRWWRDPGVEPGAEIVVPVKRPDQGTDWGTVITQATTVLASLATTWLVVDTIAND